MAEHDPSLIWQIFNERGALLTFFGALGGAVRALNGQYSAVLLANHGPVVSAKNLEAAVYASEELEETAKIFLLLRNAPTCCLNEAQLAELKTVFKLDF